MTKYFLLLLCFLFTCSLIQANEIKMEKQQKISFIDNSTSSPTYFNNKIVKFAASSGGGGLSDGGWLVAGGVILLLTGACGLAGGITMVYVNADGVHVNGFDDPSFKVEYWDKKLSTGWALWGLGIGFTVLSSLMFVGGLALIIVGVIYIFGGKSASLFINSDPKVENTSVGISIKL
jgi:hypothetical protein